MGGFAADFRGFWVARGCGEAIQRTADTGGVVGAKKILKIFKGGMENRKNWGARGARGRPEGTLYRACGATFESGS